MTDAAKTPARPAPGKKVTPKKHYEPPRVVSHNTVEVVTAACQGGNAKETGPCLIGQS